MIDLYDFVEECRSAGMTSDEAARELSRYQEEAKKALCENYYNRPDVWTGMAQQDVIDMYRRER